MGDAVIISAVRTPIGRYMGILKDVQHDDLRVIVLCICGGGGLRIAAVFERVQR